MKLTIEVQPSELSSLIDALDAWMKRNDGPEYMVTSAESQEW